MSSEARKFGSDSAIVFSWNHECSRSGCARYVKDNITNELGGKIKVANGQRPESGRKAVNMSKKDRADLTWGCFFVRGRLKVA